MEKSVFNFNAILLVIPAIYTCFFPGKIIVITAICFYPILFMLLINYFRTGNRELISQQTIKFYLIVNLVIFVRALIDLSTLQDFSVTFGNMIFTTLMFPLYIFIVKRASFIPILISTIWISFPLSFVTYFFPPTNGFMTFQHNISLIYFLIFFIPFINKKWQILIISIAVIGIAYDLTRRSFLINIAVSLLILGGYIVLSKNVFRILSKYFLWILVTLPILFLILGLSEIYNIFKIGEQYNDFVIQGKANSRNVLVDSRTSIYADVFGGLGKSNSFVFGLGGNGKVRTSLVDLVNTKFDVIYKEGRRSTESGMLNYIQWGGLVAALSYWLLLTTASYNAVFKSRNGIMQMLGLFMSFKVMYSFVEDTISVQIGSFYLLFMIALCFNKYILNLSNDQMSFVSRKVFK